MARPKKEPSYRLHQATGQARVVVDGKTHYLGTYGSPESHARYEKILAKWRLQQPLDSVTVTINQMVERYQAYANEYYRRPDGTSTGTAENIANAFSFVTRRYGRTRANEFGPKKLKTVRDDMIAAGRVRANINRLVGFIRGGFRWAVSEQLIDPSVIVALETVKDLRAGRSQATEGEAVEAVDVATVNQTLPHLPEPVRSMVKVQLLTGMRPAEVREMRIEEIDARGDVWLYTPSHRKTLHRGKNQPIPIGPRAQAVLEPFMVARETGFMFQSMPGSCYGKQSYPKVIRKTCKAKGIPHWSPRQLRKTKASQVRADHDLDTARVALGHSEARTTEIYASEDMRRAIELAREEG